MGLSMTAVTKQPGTALSVNLNAIAYLRNRRDLSWPSVTRLARAVLDAGAAGITVHPRPDQRHIRFTDVADLSQLIRDYPGREFNIEGYPTPDFLDLVAEAKADQATFVPDSPEQATSDHGWDIPNARDVLVPAIARMHALGIRVSLFIDADPAMAIAAAEIGVERVELYTASYCAAFGTPDEERVLAGFAATARAAQEHGLAVNAGHDLTLENLPAFQKAVPGVAEVSIGHAITADALLYGFPEATRLYIAALETGI